VRSVHDTAKGRSPETSLTTGTVEQCLPSKKVYKVLVDNDTIRYCRLVYTGVQTALKQGDRVVIIKCGSADWLILGMIDPVPGPSEPFINIDLDEQFAADREEFLSGNQVGNDPDFRPVDKLGQKEPPIMPGDAQLENRSKTFIGRSLVRVYSFGDIFVKASDICFTYYNKNKNWILQRGMGLLRRTYGYSETIITSIAGPLKGKTTVTETITFDPKTLAPDISVSAGVSLPETPGTLLEASQTTAGYRAVHKDVLAVEVDHSTKTLRASMAVGASNIDLQAGTFLKENAGTFTDPVVIDTAVVANGLHLRLGGGYDIVYDEQTNTLAITGISSRNQVKLSDQALSLVRGEQSLVLSDDGLSGTVRNFRMVVEGESIETAGTKSIQATTIRLN
jgi:hypothetical protein